MTGNSFEDFLSDLFKNAVLIEPRELLPFKKGEGILQKCIERYIQNSPKRHWKDEGVFNAKCSYITSEEERLFNDVLFNLFFDTEYVYGTEFYVILEEFSKLVDMTNEEIRSILNGLTMINIEIRDKEGRGNLSVSSLFPGCKSGNCLNAETEKYDCEDHYYALQINPEFLKACSEIKVEMGR